MITENLSTLKIHKMSRAQYERELAAGRIDERALYITPDEALDLTGYATKDDLATKADAVHNHDDLYYTEAEIDAKVDTINAAIEDIKDGTTPVAEATHATTADSATTAETATTATTATTAGTADVATKATQDGAGNVITETYETKADATQKLADAKAYADEKVAVVDAIAERVADLEAINHDAYKAADEALQANIDKKADATTVEAIDGRVTTLEGAAATYALKTELQADKAALSDAIAAEKTRAEGIEGGLRTDVDAIKADYLKASDKADLQNQINTIMSNPDTEGVINSINEFTTYITNHGEIADGFRTDIDKNKEDIAKNAKAIADHEALAAQTYATKTELADEKKALQAEIDADVKVVADEVDALTTEIQAVSNALTAYDDAHKSDYTNEQIDAAIKVVADNVTALGDTYATDEELATAIEAAKTDASNKDVVILAEAQKSVAAVQSALDTHAGNNDIHITADDKAKLDATIQASDITSGSANGTIAVKGTDVAVTGLGTAAYAAATDFDAAGAAAGAQAAAEADATAKANAAEAAAKAYTDEAVGAFVECSADDIAALFTE